jgi:serine/threonine-protein kinase
MKHRTAEVEDFQPTAVGRYVLHRPIARGGMATVHAARLVAAEGVTRLVAAKRLHPHFTDDPEFVEMFHDEARIASRIHHPNVVPVLDVILDGDEVILVQEYVHGVPLSQLIKAALAANEPIPLPIALAIISGVLAGIHAAHEATDDAGEPLAIVHRDVSPQNVLVSVDGIPRLVDFGIAKARTSVHQTREGFLKGKLAYMAPEQLRVEPVTRAADIYAAGVLLWELVVNRRFYDGKNDIDFVRTVAQGMTPTPTEALEGERDAISVERWAQVYLLEPIIVRAMATAPDQRFATAAEMAAALAKIAPNAPSTEVAGWVRSVGAAYLEKRQRILAANDDGYNSTNTRSAKVAVSLSTPSEVMKSSGARMRLDAITLDDSPIPSNIPTALDISSEAARWVNRNATGARLLGPWSVVAGLLVVVGVLAGAVMRGEPAPPAASFATTARPSASAEVPPLVRTAVVTRDVVQTSEIAAHAPARASAPVVGSTAPAAQAPNEAATPAPASSPVNVSNRPAPVVRWVAPARPPPVVQSRPAPVPAPIPTPTPAARADCNPPFYFEGTKKVFKPSCI